MPQRSNPFQELIAKIERALAPHGARVTESKMFPVGDDPEDEEGAREIDVFIESSLGPYNMKVAVEAKDEGRRMTIERFESIVGKYRGQSGIRVDKIVVVSRKGFSKSVVSRANKEGIELRTLEEALVEDWAARGDQSFDFERPPFLAKIDIHPEPAGTVSPEAFAQGRLICRKCGKDQGSPSEFANRLLSDADFIDAIRIEASRRGGDIGYAATLTMTHKDVVLRHGETEVRVQRLVYNFAASRARGQFAVKAIRHGDHVVHQLSGSAGGKEVELVVPNGHQSERIIVTVRSNQSPSGEVLGPAPQAKEKPTPSALASDFAERLRRDCQGLNVRVEAGAIVHDFGSGMDFPVDVLADIRFHASGRLSRGAVVCVGPEDVLDQAKLNEWESRARGAEVDRLIIVTDNLALHSNLAGSAKRTVVVSRKELSSADALQLISPTLVVFWSTLLRAECQLFSGSPKKPNILSTECEIVHGARRFKMIEYLQRVVSVATRNTFQLFVQDESLRPLFGDKDFRFEYALPRHTQIVAPDGSASDVGKVTGSTTIRACINPVHNPVRHERSDGKRALRFNPVNPSFAALITATPEVTNDTEFAGQNVVGPSGLAATALPRAAFEGFFGSDSEPLATGSFSYRIATLTWNEGDQKWSMGVFSPSQLDKLLRQPRKAGK